MAQAAKGNEAAKTTRKTSAPKAADVAEADLEDRIRRRAYDLWEAEGRPQGRDAAHWAQAERELANAGGATGGRAPRKTTKRTAARPSAAKKGDARPSR